MKPDRKKGSAAVYTIFVVSILFLLLGVTANRVLKRQKLYDVAMDEYLHYLSVSGLEKGCDFINGQAESIKAGLAGSSGVEYKYTSNNYSGEYYLTKSSLNAFELKLKDSLDSSEYKISGNTYQISYNVSFHNQNADEYEVRVVINYDKIPDRVKDKHNPDEAGKKFFNLTSYATNLNKNISTDTNCILRLNQISVTENYQEQTKPKILNSGVYCIGKIDLGEHNIYGDNTSETEEDTATIFDDSIFLEEPDKRFNDVIVGEGVNLIISDFENGIVINKSSALNISAGGKNTFNGVIISLGDINIYDETTVNGAVICAGEINLYNDITINSDSDIIYDIFVSDDIFQRKLFDFLKLTKYNTLSAGQSYQMSSIGVESQLKIKSVNCSGKLYYIDEYVARR